MNKYIYIHTYIYIYIEALEYFTSAADDLSRCSASTMSPKRRRSSLNSPSSCAWGKEHRKLREK